MSQIIDLAKQMDSSYQKLLADIETEKESQAKTRKSLSDKKKELDDREASIVSKEEELNKKLADVEKNLDKIRNDQELTRTLLECQTLRDEAEAKLKKAKESEEEAGLKLSWVADREKAVSEREATYKKKIEDEYQKKIVNTLLK